MMRFIRPTEGRCLILATVLAGLALPLSNPARAASDFPFDQELVFDAAPMRPAKRMPVLTVAEDGRATIDLWCRTVAARVEVLDGAIRVETAPLPEAMPQYMAEGQCSERRIAADSEMLAALTQVTQWRKHGDGVELRGPDVSGLAPLLFRASSH
jgi:hypothetical protein